MNETLQTIAQRSSTRAYTEEKLTEAEIQAILTAGLQAPTARNEQEIHIAAFDGEHPLLAEIEQEKRALLAAAAEGEAKESIINAPHNFYYEAPAVFILSADRDFMWGSLDAGIAVENMALAAEALGLGSVIIGIIKGAMDGSKKAYFAKECRFPENYEFEIALAVGHKAAEKKPHAFDMEKSVTIIK